MRAAPVMPVITFEVIDAVDLGWHAGLGLITASSSR
jgi:hypothetical protein